MVRPRAALSACARPVNPQRQRGERCRRRLHGAQHRARRSRAPLRVLGWLPRQTSRRAQRGWSPPL